ncbi:MAG TPA: undecaprenyl-phosphate glucose phosphotransferase, partial [Polyangiaceae bacterium]|nr:undecaprenyl-phosphate glucose phosphotransferase [Polyangiaceae bacterium]
RNRRRSIPATVAPVAGTLDQLVEDARAGAVDIVYITLPLRAEHRITSLITRLADTTATVYVVPEFYAYDLLHARWGSIGDQPVVSIFDTPFNGVGGWLKRLEDLVLGTLILALIAVPMVLIAIAVKLDSRGPVFFRQRRYGLNGKPIHVWKFRSMTVCQDGPDVPQAKVGDARITRLGAFLRRSSLDELPQFFNVIAGDMSIVGPRPHAVAHNEIYRGKIKGYMLRHKVKPGITGWAQVNGWRGETDTMDKMERRIEHDLYYIHNWRLDWDLKIILLTIFGRAARKNAV